MRSAKHSLLEQMTVGEAGERLRVRHVGRDSPRRQEAESFIRDVFMQRHGASVPAFAPELMLIEQGGAVVTAAGWRDAGRQALFLEKYLDEPIERVMTRLTGQPMARERLVEVGHLASRKPGGSVRVILAMAHHLSRLGYEWVVFTATDELAGIFARLGLPLLALARADAARLGAAAGDWGSYYEANPVVVAGRIRLALDRIGSGA